MPNRCHNNLLVSRIDGGCLTKEEISAFIQETTDTTINDYVDGDKHYKFSYQYVVPIEDTDNWWNDHINGRGCKWNSFDSSVSLDDYGIEIYRESPRSPPHKWCEAVCKKFPELKIILAYDEPGMCFQGEMGRNEEGELFDDYREGDAYLHQCFGCGFNLKDTTYREDAQDFLCDECYKDFLKRNPKKKGGK